MQILKVPEYNGEKNPVDFYVSLAVIVINNYVLKIN